MPLIQFASTDKPTQALYQLMIGCVTPRPIGWISTISQAGYINLAPFSFFNGVCANPPCFAFSVLDRRDGQLKDTAANLREVPECVVHIVSEDFAEPMNASCADFHPEVNEFEESGLTALPSHSVAPPRIEGALAAFECRVLHHLRLGRSAPHASHVVVEALYWHLDERILSEDGKKITEALHTIGRMGGTEYVRSRERFAMRRPVLDAEDPRAPG